MDIYVGEKCNCATISSWCFYLPTYLTYVKDLFIIYLLVTVSNKCTAQVLYFTKRIYKYTTHYCTTFVVL